MTHGRNLIVALDGVAVAAAKSCALQLSQDFIQACSPVSGRVREKIPATYDWSVSVDCLVPNSNLPVSLKDKLKAGTKCMLTFTDGSGDNCAGFVYVKSCDEGGSVGSLATFKAAFESSGPLYKYREYTPRTFSGSDTLEIICSSTSVSYNFEAQGTATVGIDFRSVSSASKLYISSNNIDWVLLKQDLDQVEIAVEQGHDDWLQNWYFASGTTKRLVDLQSNTTYTFLIDDHAPAVERRVLLLYEY